MNVLKQSAAILLSLAVGLTSAVPAGAITLMSAPAPVHSDVVTVGDGGVYFRYESYERHGDGRHYRYDRHNRYDDDAYYERPYRPQPHYTQQHRPGYRYHNGQWVPLAAFAAGALIGGAIAAQPRPNHGVNSGINPRHYSWCANRYRSYHAGSNTFQPNHGRRQQCYSPYF